jgi:hypothetical protein
MQLINEDEPAISENPRSLNIFEILNILKAKLY